ncbi:MAG: folate family ECF transporter S component [Clostridiales bacterium]|nr:MAG: folate family ECF transporter S component [Clostridiales bacterium]
MSNTISKAPSKEIFKTPFSGTYWRLSFAELKSVKALVLAALFIALRIAIKSFKIPVADSLNVFFTFTANALGSFLYGPVLGFISGCVCDTLSFMIKPSGPYNPVFMFIEGLGSFVFAIFLYRTKVTVLRLFLSKLAINVFCNILLTSYFLSLMYGKGIWVYMSGSITKNLLLLPIETAILSVIFVVMLPIIKKAKVVPWVKDGILAAGVLGY